eukprot:UN12387
MNDNSQSRYQFQESHNKWIETKIGFTKIVPGGIVQIPIEIVNNTQVIYMTIFVGSMTVPICDASSVTSDVVIVEYNQQLNMWIAQPHYRHKFVLEMLNYGLKKFVNAMQDIGLDDTINWMYLTEDDLKDLGFTKWQLRTFVRMAQQKFHIKLTNIKCINNVKANLY